MEATKQTKMTKEDLHLSWKDKLNIIRDNRYFLMLFPIVMLAVIILIFGVATAGRFFKLSVMKGILSQAIIIGTCATGVAFIYSNGNLDISIGAVLGLAATLGVKAYNVTQSVVVMILATVAVALGLMAFNCTMSVVCNIKTITVAIVVTQIYGAISTLLIGGSGKIDLDMSVAAMLEDGGFRYVAFFGYFIFCVVIYHFTRVGRELRFLGGNENCAAQTGISNSRATYISFLMTGVGVGLAAVFSVIDVSAVSVETGRGLGCYAGNRSGRHVHLWRFPLQCLRWPAGRFDRCSPEQGPADGRCFQRIHPGHPRRDLPAAGLDEQRTPESAAFPRAVLIPHCKIVYRVPGTLEHT